MDVERAVVEAHERIRSHVIETPVWDGHWLGPGRVHLKLENVQHTGSFKLRGALNKLLSLDDDERGRGIVAASSGNHGAAVAFGTHALGARGVVFVPEGTGEAKIEAIRAHGAEVRVHGSDCVLTEAHARRHADEHGMVYLSPYNDPAVVTGQGTVALELVRQVGGLDAVFVALGGGGLISGIGGYLKAVDPDVRIVACSPENSPVMHESLRAGRILELETAPTLSDSTAGGVERDSITFELCQHVVDDSVLVSEAEIADAVRLCLRQHLLIEGAAGVAVAGFLKMRERFADARAAVILCGSNISLEQLRAVLAHEMQ